MLILFIGFLLVTENANDMRDSDLLKDVFNAETDWVSHSPLQTLPCVSSTPVSLHLKPFLILTVADNKLIHQ